MDRQGLSKKKERTIDTCINVFFIILFVCSLVIMIAMTVFILAAVKSFTLFILSAFAIA